MRSGLIRFPVAVSIKAEHRKLTADAVDAGRVKGKERLVSVTGATAGKVKNCNSPAAAGAIRQNVTVKIRQTHK